MKTPLTVSNKWFLAENVVTVLKANFLSQLWHKKYMILMILKELNCNEIKRSTKFCHVPPMPVGNGMEFIFYYYYYYYYYFYYYYFFFITSWHWNDWLVGWL